MTYSILIIEDEPTLREKLALALTETVFKVTDISDYFEALWALSESKPDLLIMDEKLPQLDKWQACYWLHQTFDIPIVLLGRDSSDEAWTRAVQAGVDFYLRMPFGNLELPARVKAILRRCKRDSGGTVQKG